MDDADSQTDDNSFDKAVDNNYYDIDDKDIDNIVDYWDYKVFESYQD